MKLFRLSTMTVLAVLVLAAASPAPAATPLLNGIFQDHAVLQRDKPISIWGRAAPGASVTVALAGETATGQADANGSWSATLPAMKAGGPYTITAATGGESQTVNDVLIGDVWLCSGQSNMVLAVKDTIDAGAEIAISGNDSIRLMTVANETSPTPLSSLPTPITWQAASPASVPGFSATCYYFARELQKSVHVPLGLVQSAWNGANITTFIGASALRKIGGYDDRLDALSAAATDQAAGMKQWGGVLENWWRGHLKGAEPWSVAYRDDSWPAAPSGLGYWSDWNIPSVAQFTGNMWLRTSVTLTEAQAAQASELLLGNINEEDETWVNGAFIADTFAYGALRQYKLPAGALHAGKNVIVTNVFCGWRGCGMFGPAQDRVLRLKDGTAVPLGTWRYQTVPSAVGSAPRAPWGATAGTSVAYNAMIAPLAPYGFRGAVWYQGESNTDHPDQYAALLKGMMADWRGLFGADLPFLIVQLPTIGVPLIKPENASWADLREAQRAVAAGDPNAALAVTIDAGDHFGGLHPGNKQEVGRRLALAARRVVYHEAGIPTGPVAVSARPARHGVVVQFTENDLVAYNASQPIGFELCGAAGTDCRWAVAHIRGGSVWLDVEPKFHPTHVRYCWGGGPICTLYDAARLPAGPFDLPVSSTRVPKAHTHHHRKHRAR